MLKQDLYRRVRNRKIVLWILIFLEVHFLGCQLSLEAPSKHLTFIMSLLGIWAIIEVVMLEKYRRKLNEPMTLRYWAWRRKE